MKKYISTVMFIPLLMACSTSNEIDSQSGAEVIDVKATKEKVVLSEDNTQKVLHTPTYLKKVEEDLSTVDASEHQSKKALDVLNNIEGIGLIDISDENLATPSEIELLETSTDTSQRPMSEGNELPTYASRADGSQANCDLNLDYKASDLAKEMALDLISRYQGPHERVYVATTIVPDKYIDCISSVHNDIVAVFLDNPRLEVARNIDLIRGPYTASAIPLLIKEARKNNVQYLAISMVREQKQGPMLSLRLVRVKDGITLSQSFKPI